MERLINKIVKFTHYSSGHRMGRFEIQKVDTGISGILCSQGACRTVHINVLGQGAVKLYIRQHPLPINVIR